ncbi:MAG: hypothetical protein KZQ64_06775 [gamma proteobacterium symbiont of Bathyaustriella thionipta]|nr:hypothetical protein [gamma proteobacterium symbiont of Bathyaustriella thionipta]MCU7950427.1 hypothetical protein [gamma proteobacterium symbiont of Bathyaustriella thionipta]MCU7953077.1 hypothetical protein [gamma proteobacterium symbiont of Bathyaustriella thionipta]MCU7956933.1 hypothetical protein [gamma proteobacterium symbiont of Bathyaustriella thionipta]MCU7965651.1 hypothetical protein [gamma proteobacterium symbiont of Bathyaustriella thionipta]
MTSCTTSLVHHLTAYGHLEGEAGCGIIEGFSGNKAVKIWSDYITPNTNSAASQIQVNGNNIPTTQGSTTTLSFINGVADYTVYYPDAGEIKLNFKYDKTPYNNDPFNAMNYDEQFVVAPAGLHLYSDDAGADCAGSNAGCSKFKKVGEAFNLKIKAYCESGNPAGPVTPNFQLDDIDLSHLLIAPVNGKPGNIAINNFAISAADQGIHLINNQSVSEVGVFQFQTPALDYLGIINAINSTTSDSIGRFYPAFFTVSHTAPIIEPACAGDNFTYMGQAFGFLTPGKLTITAKDIAGNTVSNYSNTDGENFWKLSLSDATQRSYSDTTGLSAINNSNTLSGIEVDPVGMTRWENIDNAYDGSGDTIIEGDYLSYTKNKIAPFAEALDLTFNAAGLTDSDGACYKANHAGACLDYTLAINSLAEQRYGRLMVANAYGSELLPLTDINLTTEYYDGSHFILNTKDNCTAYDSSYDVINATGINWPAATYSVNFSNGDINAAGSGVLSSGSGTFTIDQTPVPRETGYVDYQFGIKNWLKYDWDNNAGTADTSPEARASFGIYNRSRHLIYTREVY